MGRWYVSRQDYGRFLSRKKRAREELDKVGEASDLGGEDRWYGGGSSSIVKVTEQDGYYHVTDMPLELLNYTQIVNWAFATKDLRHGISFNGSDSMSAPAFLKLLTSKEHPEVKEKLEKTAKGQRERVKKFLDKLTPEERAKYFNQPVEPREFWEKE